MIAPRWRPLACLLALASSGCGSDPEATGVPAPPVDPGIHGHANGCFAVQGADGAGARAYLATTGADAFAFSGASASAAARFFMRASDLGTYLLYDAERRYLTAAEGSGGWALTRSATLESEHSRLEDGFISPAEWELQRSERDTTRYQLRHRASGRYLTLSGLTDAAATAAILTFTPAEGCTTFPELTVDATGVPTRRQWDDGDVYGIAEMHSHMMTSFGFGGGNTFHGAPWHRLGVEHALPDCSPWHGDEGRRDVVSFFFDGPGSSLAIEDLVPIGTTGSINEFNHFTAGYPDFTDWPRSWKSSTHQTMYYRWLERAYLGGLRLLVQHVTGNSVLCELVNGVRSQTKLYSCNDMVTADRSIAATRELERYIDAQAGGPGLGWFRVVESPAEARAAILDGKLAVVLGIEISNLFDCFLTPPAGFERCTPETVEAKIEQYRGLGVRAIFPVHKFDNGFSAGDGQGGVLELGNFINSGHYSNLGPDCTGPYSGFDSGDITFGGLNRPRAVYDSPAPVDMSGFADAPLAALLPHLSDIQAPAIPGEHCQQYGLTPLGEGLIQGLMRRGMLIDIAHLPRRALGRAYELLEANEYPALKTHGETNGGRLYALGGLTGTGFGRCATAGQVGSLGAGLTAAVADRAAHGHYPAEGLSFDLNGFAGGPRPRFGPDATCSDPQSNPVTYPFTSFDGAVTFDEPELGNRTVDFNTEGMIHIGLLPELIEDARRDGTTDAELEPLFRSAEAFVRMWERAEERGRALAP